MANRTQMEQDVDVVLAALAEYANPYFTKPEEDPNRGRHSLEPDNLREIISIPWERIKDALDVLVAGGYVEYIETLSGIHDVILTAQGRNEYQRRTAGSEQQTQSSQTQGGQTEDEAKLTANIDSRKVFVVHGRNEAIREAVFDFLRALDLAPIEWAQAIAMTRKGTPYVGEVLDAALANAQAIVVVMTPDDEARLRGEFQSGNDLEYEKELTPQARPNVLFEAGLALGREPDRTILVEIGKLRPISDLAGRHLIRLDNSVAKRQALATRLKEAGCSVNLDGIDWHTAGHLEISESNSKGSESNSNASAGDGSRPNDVNQLDAGFQPHENEVEILKVIGNLPRQSMTPADLAASLSIHKTRILYHLDNLTTQEYLSDRYSNMSGTHYQLTPKGRRYLAENDFI